MSEWVEVSRKHHDGKKKEIIQKSSLNIIGSNKTISYNQEETYVPSGKTKSNLVNASNIDSVTRNSFEDLYGYELENEFNRLLGDLKPTSILLNNVSRVDIEEFFYEYIDIENSVKRVQITPDKKDNCYSDEEYY
jgi:hypothetical protein